MSQIHELKVLVSSYHSLITIERAEEDRIQRSLRTVAHQLNINLVEWSSTQGISGIPVANAEDSISADVTLSFFKEFSGNVILWLKDFDKELESKSTQRLLKDVVKKYNRTLSTVIITGAKIALSGDLKDLAVNFEFNLPSKDEYRAVIEGVYESLCKTHKLKYASSPESMDKLLNLLSGLTLQQARQVVAQAFISDGSLDSSDYAFIEEKKIKVIKEDGLLEYYPPQQNTFEIGGFATLKKWLTKMEAGFSEEARALKLPQPKGVLFVGVPGCGKSLAAKYVARKWQMPLFKLDAGRLLDKYIGESEKNFRRAVKMAESVSPSILWIDEIEKSMVASGDMDGGVSKRLFGAFLTWLQEKTVTVFVVATANDLLSLPAELLRKGRFDEIFFVDLPNSSERAEIFKIHLGLRKLKIDDVNLGELVSLTESYSGAEIEQVVVGAALHAIQQKTKITLQFIKDEIQNTIPLSRSREDYISEIRRKGSEFRPVN